MRRVASILQCVQLPHPTSYSLPGRGECRLVSVARRYPCPMTSARPCRLCGALVADDQHLEHLRWHSTVDPELEEPTSEHGIWTRDGEWIEL